VTIAVVPVKELGAAKGRLSARLGPRERRELVLAMLDDVLTALSRVQGLSGMIVVTREPEIASIATRFGAELLEDPVRPVGRSAGGESAVSWAGRSAGGESAVFETDGYTNAVEHAVRELERRREPAMLSVPGDVPAVTPQEIAEILAAVARTAVVLVPSRDERGTNAVLLRPPNALPLRFGEPSFTRHLERAERLGLRAEVLRLPGLSLDLDTPADLDEFLRSPSPTRTYRLLAAQARP
jgi:2-phospho-L-lactate/phosphoenolpyruvate guanylyltransferase